MSIPCTVKLDIFEGPLDLLLHLIKKSEVEITDIPIAAITDQYLAAIEYLQELNLDGAGEYLVMAATLMYIKSRMLLPSLPMDDEIEEDPRAELVQQLLEYQRYREVASALGERRVLGRDVFAARGEPLEFTAEVAANGQPPVRDASLADLLTALREVLQRARPPQPHEILREPISIRSRVQLILARFAVEDEVEFMSLFSPDAHRGEIIATFLALLELTRLAIIRAQQAERFGAICLTLVVASLAEANELVRHLGELWRGEEEADGSPNGSD